MQIEKAYALKRRSEIQEAIDDSRRHKVELIESSKQLQGAIKHYEEYNGTLTGETSKLEKELNKIADEIVNIGQDASRTTTDSNREIKQFNSNLQLIKAEAEEQDANENEKRRDLAAKIRELKEADAALQGDIDQSRENLFQKDSNEGARIKRLHDKFRNFDEFMIKNNLGRTSAPDN